MADEFRVDKTIDIRGLVCPYTFVHSKLAIEKMNSGEVLLIMTDQPQASENVPRSMENEGQTVLKLEQTGRSEWRIYIRKDRDKKRKKP